MRFVKDANDPRWWGEVRDPEIVRVKIDGVNYYQVWQDYAMIDQFKSRAPAKRLVKLMEELNEGSLCEEGQ